MIFLYAFLIGGLFCLVAQLIMDVFNLLPIHITSLFVFIGALLDTRGFYDKIVDFAGAGALMPITSFGHSLTHAALEQAQSSGVLGLAAGIFDLTATGITAAIIFSFLVGLLFKPRG